jgi:phosphinothricin acetyltransferase
MENDTMIIRPGSLADLPRITEIHNYYVQNTHVTFDVRPFTPEERLEWFHAHSDNRRRRILVAEDDGKILGYTATGAVPEQSSVRDHGRSKRRLQP